MEQRLPGNQEEIEIKYANTLLKLSHSTRSQFEAAGIYHEILRKSGGREDVRKLLLDLKFEMRQFVSSRGAENGADADLKILLESDRNKADGHLWYLKGRCHEAEGDDPGSLKSAVESYQKAVNCNVLAWTTAGERERIEAAERERIEAAERLAILLRSEKQDKPKPKEARDVIDKLVKSSQESLDKLDKSDPQYENARRTLATAHLARGRFWLEVAAHDQSRKSLESDAKKDFEKARELNPTEPEVYLQLAQAAMKQEKPGYNEARQILEDGLRMTGCTLRLMFGKSDMPSGGKNLIVVAVVQNVLHFRVFDHAGKLVIDTDEKKLTAATEQIAEFRDYLGHSLLGVHAAAGVVGGPVAGVVRSLLGNKAGNAHLEGLGPPYALTEQEKGQVIKDVISIVGYALPIPAALYQVLATLESFVGDDNGNRAVEVLELGLMNQPDLGELRLQLTDLLANRGDTGKLLLQIKELKKLGCSPILTQYYTAWYHINSRQFLTARHLLATLQAGMKTNGNAEKTNRASDMFKSKISVLLAQCYGELGEPEMQRHEYLHALSANPQDLRAKIGWISNMVSQGNIAGAIKEYRALVKQIPKVRPDLVRLLIAQNQRRPELQRDWNEVNKLIDQMADTEPEAVEVLRAEMLFARGDQTAALDKLEKAQVRFPKSLAIRLAQTNKLGIQGRVDEALLLLDQAQQQLGDLVDLRLERARLWALKKGPQFHQVLMDLSQDAEKFSKVDRKRLLNGLAIEFDAPARS